MAGPIAGIAAGIIAGAAGTTALNAVSYADQALRGRPGGSSPKQTVDALADAAGVDVPGGREASGNRSEGLGALAGMGVGIGVGIAASLLRTERVKAPKGVAAVAVGLGAMAISDSVMAALGISDPREWTSTTVAMDALPHLAYGLMTTATLHRLLDPRTPHAR